ncbi:MAG TPA: type I-MYXAN CRISPR-associated protein Cmx8, partial [Leptospiraceae bacterium]|nr:type I-MYXAN CRISPR-associated protein Cmx8 [Leptospiraceae bacterium]
TIEEVKEITLEYKLHDLPSSQHKAGLAGLYLVIKWLNEQGESGKDILGKTEISETGLKVTLTKNDVKDLFDEIYKSEDVEIISKSEPKKGDFQTFEKIEKTIFYFYETEAKSKRKDKETNVILEPTKEIIKKEKDKRTGNIKDVKYYIYLDKFQEKKQDEEEEEIEPIKEEEFEDTITYYKYKMNFPKGSVLKGYDKTPDSSWIKLWREAQWLLKGDRQRLIYENPYKEVEIIWEKFTKDKKENDLSKVLFLSAQNNNAEKVDFKEINKNKFLLHFWVFVAQPYAYWTQRKDKKKYKTDEHGFIFAVPDISKLESFIFIFNDLIQSQDNEIKEYPIKRPEQAVVYLPGLAGLLLLKSIHDILKRKLNSNYSDVVHGVDLFHYDFEWKSGKAKKNRASIFKGYTRIKPDIEFENKAAGIKKLYKNFFFQKQMLQNLFEQRDELYNFYNLFSTREYEYFFKYWDGEFKPDAKTYFEEKKIKGEQEMSDDGKIPKTIEPLVHQIVRTYVYSKMESKYQLVWDKDKKLLWSKAKNAPADDKDYENKSKIAKDAFLAIRSRKDKDDFITYFTSTICSVSQYLGEEGYTLLAGSLYNENEALGWEKIRALSMLALSANS